MGSSPTSPTSASSSHLLKYFSRRKKPLDLSPTEESSKHTAPPQSPPTNCSFIVAVSEDRNRKCRRTMEDAHTFIYNFGDIVDSGYFGLFDGHAGAACAEWCAKRLHVTLDNWIKSNDRETLRQIERKKLPTSDNKKFRTDITAAHALGSAFLEIDAQVGKMNMQNSGCTAAVAVIRWEDSSTGVPLDFQLPVSDSSSTSPTSSSSLSSKASKLSKFVRPSRHQASTKKSGPTNESTPTSAPTPTNVAPATTNLAPVTSSGTTSTTATNLTVATSTTTDTTATTRSSPSPSSSSSNLTPINRRRMLYVANVGDSRVVLCRAGKAYRLTYDHKGSDPRESRRISNSGGIMMNNRVNGVLAVTRSLGDTYMKDLVTGAPYTTETQLQYNDEFFILACDGLWDVCTDQKAVDLVRNIQDPKEASDILVEYALKNFSSDNLTIMVVRLDQTVFEQPEAAKVDPIPKPAVTTESQSTSADTTPQIPSTESELPIDASTTHNTTSEDS